MSVRVSLGEERGEVALTAWGHITVLPRQLSVLQHVTPRLGIPIWIPIKQELESFSDSHISGLGGG